MHAGLVGLSQKLSGVEDGNFPRPVADTPSNKKIELESSRVSSLERRKINEGSWQKDKKKDVEKAHQAHPFTLSESAVEATFNQTGWRRK